MMSPVNDPLQLTVIYLLAMVATVPIARRLGLGAVLGYLVAGVALGPGALGLLSGEDANVSHIAEFGVIMMLFLIGLELNPARLWRLRGPIFGLGTAQVALCSAALAAFLLVAGAGGKAAIAAGLTLSLSSTAIVLQTLQERGALKTTGGQAAFAVLLFQDIAVIPMLALFPLLGDGAAAAGTASAPAWTQALRILGAVALVIVTGRYLIRPIFHAVGAARLRELFTAMALLLVVATTLLMHVAGLSPALGAFLAGVVLANNEYRHQLETDIEPFKGLLLGVFFISVGAGIDLARVADSPGFVLGTVAALVLLKGALLAGLGRAFRLPAPDSLLLAFSLAQGGEFAFVLLQFAEGQRILDAGLNRDLTAAVALSMFAAPLLIQFHLRFVEPRFATPAEKRGPDAMPEERHPVIIAGFGRFGQMVTRLLRVCDIPATVLDHDVEQIEIVRRFGHRAYYGDASNMDLLRAAGAAEARLLIVAIDDAAKTLEIVESAKKEFPNLEILVRAYDRIQAYELIGLGVEHPYIETAGSALHLGTDALRRLGMSAHQAHRAAQLFLRRNDESIRELARVYHQTDEAAYVAHARGWLSALEDTLRADQRGQLRADTERGWESAPRAREQNLPPA